MQKPYPLLGLTALGAAGALALLIRLGNEPAAPRAEPTITTPTLYDRKPAAPPTAATASTAFTASTPATRCRSPGTATSQTFRVLSPQAWRELNAWQRERGLAQTRQRADGELVQEPSPYLHYDNASLRLLADSGDADAMYWLAIHYQQPQEFAADHDRHRDDPALRIPQLLDRAALHGHVPAMLALGDYYYQQALADSPHQPPAQSHPDLQIKARAWQQVADWRLGQRPRSDLALTEALETQAAQLARQLIADLQQRREQQGLPALDNSLPHAVLADRIAQDRQRCDAAQPARIATMRERTPRHGVP